MFVQPTYDQAKAFVLLSNTAGVSVLQRRFKIGYTMARKITEQMEVEGLISVVQPDGSRKVFDPTTKKPLTHSLVDTLQVHTLIGDENRKGGLMLCGINHGYSKADERADTLGVNRADLVKSFFSDAAVNDYAFRNRIVKWFGSWGYELGRTEETAGDFERSIVQTNWLQSCSNNVHGQNIRTACIADAESFLHSCETLAPSVLIFFGREMLWAFTGQELSTRVQSIFGMPVKATHWRQNCVAENGKQLRAFRVGFMEYERLKVICLPHPTGSRGLSDDYIASFKPYISEVVDPWWKKHVRRRALLSELSEASAELSATKVG